MDGRDKKGLSYLRLALESPSIGRIRGAVYWKMLKKGLGGSGLA